MDRLLTGDIPKTEHEVIKRKILDLVDIYYVALDAPKSGDKVISNPGLACFAVQPSSYVLF
jgi:RNA-dependent RNA polymerase